MSKETYNPRKNHDCNRIFREILKALSSSNTAPDEDEERFSFQLFQPYEICPKRKNWTFV